jgi:4-hydroxymandelate oxidase
VGAFGVPAIISTFSTTALETVARAATGPLWFQLYVYRDRAITRRLVERAEACGVQALVLTVDVPVTGKRERDRRAPLALPPGVTLANFAEFALDRPDISGQTSALIAYAQGQLDPSLTWEALDWLRGITAMPIWVKGVLRGDDAAEAIAYGAAGVIVSNHGGRQLDGATASLTALPEVVAAVGGRGEVLLDGGVRRGADVVRALALGARAVLIGRPALWALAYDGEAGVRLMLDLLRDEFDRALALCGCRAPGEVTGSLIAPRDSGSSG